MPDEKNKPSIYELSQEHRTIIHAWLEEKWKDRDCPMCGSGPWRIPEHLLMLRVAQVERPGYFNFGPSYPLLPVMCENCTNTILINAMAIGGIMPEEPETPEVASGKQ